MAKSATPQVDASMFEDTPIRSLKNANKADDERAGAGTRTANIKLKNGKNTVRFAPKRRGESSWIIQRKSTWMSIVGNEGDMIRRPIEDSKLHGGTALDIIQEYLKLAQSKLSNTKAGQAKLAIFADREKGMSTKNSFVAYAWLKGEENGEVTWHFGEYEFGKAVRDGIDAAAVAEDEDEEISVDPFTPVKTGRGVLITYNNQAKRAPDFYKVGLSSKATPLSQEMLLEISTAKSLTEKYRNSYTKKDFMNALGGIEHFDTTHEIELCETQEWEDIKNTVASQYEGSSDATDDDDEEEAPAKSKKAKAVVVKAKAKPVVEEDDEDEDEDDEEEEEAPVVKKKAAAAAPAPKSKKLVIEEDEDDDDDDDTPPFDMDDDDDDDEEDEAPAPIVKKKTNAALEKVKSKLGKK